MFSVGDYVVCGNKGACKVQQITTLDITGANAGEEYYILKPVYSPGSTVYVPVEPTGNSLRPVLSRKEAEKLIRDLAKIPELTVANEKLLEQEYKGCIRSNDARDLVKLLKTLYSRRQKREAAGRKETALDAKYLRMAGDYLFGELAISLEMPKNEVEKYLDAAKWRG